MGGVRLGNKKLAAQKATKSIAKSERPRPRRPTQRLRELESPEEKRFRILADNAPVMVWVSGQDKLCTFFNKPWLDFTGRTMEQELGNGWANGVHPEDLDRCLAIYISSFDARRAFRMEYRLRRADGEYRWILDHGVPLHLDGEFAGFIGSCVDLTEQKQVEGQLRQSQTDLRALTARLLGLQESAASELARELHDVVSQELALVGMEISSLENELKTDGEGVRMLSKLRERIRKLSIDVHRTSRKLHPTIIEDLGLVAALRQECDAFRQRNGIHTEFLVSNVPSNIPWEVALCLYRIAQEALHNVRKHAPSSSQVRVSLTGYQEGVTLRLQDAGDGFNADPSLRRGGLGLISMDERIRLVSGKLTIESQPGEGTTVAAFVPLSGHRGVGLLRDDLLAQSN